MDDFSEKKKIKKSIIQPLVMVALGLLIGFIVNGLTKVENCLQQSTQAVEICIRE